MNTARIVVLSIAIGAGGLAAWLASGSDRKSHPAPVAAKIETVDVLVAKADIPLGKTVTPADLQWQTWPAAAASDSFVRRDKAPDAPTKFAGAIARSPFVSGEPIRDSKLVMAGGSGFMAAVLPAGMRAISTEISAETGAGGFILPNDRVDVILSRRDKSGEQGSAEVALSETILTNVRVLAIDQKPSEDDKKTPAVVGKTATLELRPEQAETLARARQSGTITLALRSLADANAPVVSDAGANRRESVNVVRYGVSTKATARQ